MTMSIGLIRELIKEVLHEKGEVIVYHASPQLDLKRINPKYSPKFGTEGVFGRASSPRHDLPTFDGGGTKRHESAVKVYLFT